MKKRNDKIYQSILYYIIIIIIVILIFFMTLNLFKSRKEKIDSFEYNSIKLDKDNKLLHITPAKRCEGGAFLNDTDCKNVSKKELDCFSCGEKGIIGRPVHFEYTPLSDNNWKNPRCKEANKTAKCSFSPLTPATL